MPVRSDHRSATVEQAKACESTDLVEAMLRVSQQIRRLLNERLEACDLNDVRYAVLCMVSRSADRGGCSQAELAARLDQSESSVSMLVDRMRADRLIHRLHAPTDRRRRRLVLTEEGRALIQQANQVYSSFVNTLLASLRDDTGLREQLGKLSTMLADSAFVSALRQPHFSTLDAAPSADSRQHASDFSTPATDTSPGFSPAA